MKMEAPVIPIWLDLTELRDSEAQQDMIQHTCGLTGGIGFFWPSKSKRIGDKQDALQLLSEQKKSLKVAASVERASEDRFQTL